MYCSVKIEFSFPDVLRCLELEQNFLEMKMERNLFEFGKVCERCYSERTYSEIKISAA